MEIGNVHARRNNRIGNSQRETEQMPTKQRLILSKENVPFSCNEAGCRPCKMSCRSNERSSSRAIKRNRTHVLHNS